ncbi:hypothetical protein SDC9_151703 [bioreactor metagenome]|uniref:Uncharacterized protein n=1 Tax=bioreactor metagenome TaxID=1076179 RepID=A0A645ER04_9ZZZZ
MKEIFGRRGKPSLDIPDVGIFLLRAFRMNEFDFLGVEFLLHGTNVGFFGRKEMGISIKRLLFSNGEMYPEIGIY